MVNVILPVILFGVRAVLTPTPQELL